MGPFIVAGLVHITYPYHISSSRDQAELISIEAIFRYLPFSDLVAFSFGFQILYVDTQPAVDISQKMAKIAHIYPLIIFCVFI